MSTLRRFDEKFLITPKLIYFTVASVNYAFSIFRIQFCQEYYGFQKDKAGDIAAVLSLAGFISMTLWSSVADYLGRHRLILGFLALATAGTFELLLFRFASIQANYYYSLGIFTIFGALLSGLLPLTDYQILKLLSDKFHADRNLYGRQRMMGTISYGITTYILGILIDYFGVTVLFYVFPVCALLFATSLFAFGYPDHGRKKTPTVAKPAITEDMDPKSVSKEEELEIPFEGKVLEGAVKPPIPEQTKPSIWLFFKSLNFMFFLLVVFITGCGRQIVQVYLPPFLKETMKMSSRQAGTATLCSTFSSIIYLFFGSTLLRIFGAYMMLVMAMLMMALRLGCYILLPHNESYSWVVYAIELLNGAAFINLAGVKVVTEYAPKGLEATGQAIYISFYMQLPAVVISFAGGRLYKAFGGEVLFKYASFICFAFSLLTFAKYLVEGRIPLIRRRSLPQ